MINQEERIIEQRKKKIVEFVKSNPNLIFVIVLVALIILGFYIRYLPLSDHNGRPGLWDATTNDYTLGPDLDPFLFLRYARTIIENGSLPKMDMMRNVPFGFDASTELQMVSYMIVLTYKLVNVFGTHSINYAGAFMPVWVFLLTIVAFFFFVREIFIRKNEKESFLKSNIIASIATGFMIVIPGFLSRTVAGIPEKESVGFFFMFLAFFLFLRAWKCEKTINSCVWGILAGIATGLMGLTWGGVNYIYITMGLASLVAFVLNKVGKKETIMYGLWLIFSLLVQFTFTNRFSLKAFVFGFDTGLACLTFGFMIIHLILWNTRIAELINLNKIKLSKNITSIILAVLIGLLAVLVIDYRIITERLSLLNNLLINPITGRWNTTVAENRQPYFTEWVTSFGKIFFWIFIIGSVVLFKEMFNKIRKKESWVITGLFVFFLAGLMFSRYAAHPALFDGEGLISKIFYYVSALLLIGATIYYYNLYHKEKDSSFEKIDFEFIFLFSLYVLTLFTARSAVRLIMVLVPIAPIFAAYFIVKLGFYFKNNKENRVLTGIFFLVILGLSLFTFYNYYNEIKQESYNFVPNYYTNQWQNAMSWIRTNTPTNSVFAHWWDYGYWVQSIGDRATVTDGGNAIVWWNYLTGRYVLTGDNQKDALDFLWNHNATHLLIDSSDIGKYGAYSQIGSDANFDRLSAGPMALFSDIRQVREEKDGTLRSYIISVGPIEEDISYEMNGTKSTMFKETTGLGGINLKMLQGQNSSLVAFKQPEAVFYSNGQAVTLPLRYVYYDNKLLDYETGVNAAVFIIPNIYNIGQGLQVDNMGTAIYISPRVLKGAMAQLYLLDNSLGNFNNFELVHTEPNLIVSYFKSQGANIGDFIYYNGIQGPIKIWDIKYSGHEILNENYTAKRIPSDINWKF
jgi:asparagine N-glycosylation enzyme membrane subunit Stt3